MSELPKDCHTDASMAQGPEAVGVSRTETQGPPVASSDHACRGARISETARWFVCRYGRLTDGLRRIADEGAEGFEVVLPFYMRRELKRRSVKEELRPILPGYVFVKGHHDRILAHEVLGALRILRNRSDHWPLTLSDQQMSRIVRFAEDFRNSAGLDNDDLRLEDAADIDRQMDDYVEILEGQFAGCRGYFKTRERCKTGTFYFDLDAGRSRTTETADAAASCTGSGEEVDALGSGEEVDALGTGEKANVLGPQTMAGAIVPAMDVSSERVKIIRFAPANGHSRDYIGKAYKRAARILEMARGTDDGIADTARKAVRGWIVRYSDVAVEDSVHRKANLWRLLLVCHAVLGNRMQYDRLYSMIHDRLFPAYERFANGRRSKKEREAARKAFHKYRNTIEHVHFLYNVRKEDNPVLLK